MASNDLPMPQKFKVVGQHTNLSSTWEEYIKRFNYYIQATGITNDTRKKALLLHLGGEDIQDIYETTIDTTLTFQQTLTEFTAYFNPKKNVAYERHKFRQEKQHKDETVDNYIIRLKKLSLACEFPDGTVNDMIRDQVVETCASKALKIKLLKEENLDLEKVQKIARSNELANLHAEKMHEAGAKPSQSHNSEGPDEVNLLKRQGTRKKHVQYQPRARPAPKPARHITCYRCGARGHGGHECMKSRNIVCYKCKTKGHYATMCKAKKAQVHLLNKEYDENLEQFEDYAFNLNTKDRSPHVEAKIDGIKCDLLIDSGSSVNVLDRATYEKIRSDSTKLSRANSKIYPFAQSKPIKVIGIAEFQVEINGKTMKLKFHIIDKVCTSLLGYKSAIDSGLLKICVNNVGSESSESRVKEIIKEYEDRFQGVGKLKDFQLKLNIKKDVNPIAQPNRRIPFQMRKRVNEKIQQLLDDDIIEKMEGATPWISPLVVIPKRNGDIRICVDMRQANTAIQRERFPMPNIDETLEEVSGAKFYTKLDLNLGFHQVELDEKSREITTFVTNDAIYRYKRLFFGISCAPEIYQRIIQHTIQDIPNCKNISDDILIWGSTKAQHDETLRKVLQRLRDKNLTLNRAKSEFCKTSIEYMGHTLTSEGLKLQESKIQAVLNMTPPENVKQVKSLLGLLNYCAKFLPNWATVSEPIRKLTRSGVPFQWKKEQQDSFETLQEMLTSAQVMAFYNPQAETTITVDGSGVGIGAILSQEQSDGHFKPVAYASRTLNAIERRFSAIESEMLAATWAIERFRTYVYGKTFKLVTDHAPLLNIFKPTHKPPMRLERMLMKLQPYKFTVEHRAGSSNPADILSRPKHSEEKCKISSITEQYMDYVCTKSVPSAMTLDEIDQESSKDTFIQKLKQCVITNKWPKGEKEFNVYFKIRSELSVYNNIVLRGSRIIVPEGLQQKVLQLAHLTHQGIVKTKQMLREKVYWQNIDNEVVDLIKTCHECQLNTNPPQQTPVIPTELPKTAWSYVACDITGPFPGGESILVCQDMYSRFPEVEIIKNTSSRTIIHKLMRIFSTHGLPEVIKTDNAPNFVSEEIKGFFKTNGIKHHRVTPYLPQANGLVENFNKTLSKCIKTAVAGKRNWRTELFKFLLDYRTTPHVTLGASPASLLFNRTVRNKLPHIPDKKNDTILRKREEKQKAKMKKYADRKASKRIIAYRLGQKVLILNKNTGKLHSKWSPEIYTVIGQTGTQVKIKSRFNETFRRHVSQVRPYYDR